jgi:putative transposase
MPQSFGALYYHFVFSTKQRNPVIAPAIQPHLFEYIGGLCRARESKLLAAGGMPDHIHLLVSMSREWAVSDFLRDIKANSSKCARKLLQLRHRFEWQEGYGAFSVSHSKLVDVKGYLGRQAEHHRKKTFQEEFVELLDRHELDYDKRYIWN